MRDMGVHGAKETTNEARPWWESRLCLTLVVFATMLPLIYPPIPPLVDLFGHMGRYRVMLDIGHSPWLQQYYGYHSAPIGNLGVDMLVWLLGRVIGLEPAVKLIILAIPPLTAIGFLWVAREVHGRVPPTAFFALPFIYGYPFLFGFVNFALSIALAFLAFGLWLRLGRLGRTALRGALFGPISVVLFFAHTYGWGLLGLLCFSADAVRLHDRGRSWWRAGAEAALHTSVMALPLLILFVWRGEVHSSGTGDWFNWRVKWEWIYTALRDRWGQFDRASLAFVVVIFVAALFSRALTLSRNLAFSAIVLAICFALLPRIIFDSAYADMRLVPYLMAVGLLAIRFRGPPDRRTAQLLAVVGLLFFSVRTAANTASLAIAASDQKAKLEALNHVPEGARVFTITPMTCRAYWPLLRNSHLGAMVMVRRDGFSNDQWLVEGANLLQNRYHPGNYFVADPSQLVRPNQCHDALHLRIDDSLANFPRDYYDYLWLIDPPPHDPQLVAGLSVVWRGPGSVLYRLH